MTFLQLYDDLLDIELGTSAVDLFTVQRRKDAVNEAMRDFVRITNCTKKYGSISISDGVAEYDLEASFTDFVRLSPSASPSIKIVSGSTTTYIQGKDAFRRFDPEERDTVEPGWRASSASRPNSWYTREDGSATFLGMNPGPDVTGTDVWSWIVPYTAYPDALSNNSDVPFSFSSNAILRLDPYHRALVHKAAAILEPLRKNYSAVDRQTRLYSGWVAQFLQSKTEEQPDQIAMVRDYYGEAHRGARPPDPRSWP